MSRGQRGALSPCGAGTGHVCVLPVSWAPARRARLAGGRVLLGRSRQTRGVGRRPRLPV